MRPGRRWWTRAQPALFGVVGAPGIGKSRLLAEFGERVGDGAGVHWGRCLPYGEGITYWPVTEIVKSAAGILQSDDRATTVTKLDAFIDGLPTKDPDELRTIAAALSNVIGIPDDTSRHVQPRARLRRASCTGAYGARPSSLHHESRRSSCSRTSTGRSPR